MVWKERIVKNMVGTSKTKDAVDKVGKQVGPYDMDMSKKL